jgi:hypothetical protein
VSKEEVVRCDHCKKIIEGKVTTAEVLGISRDFDNDCFQEFDKLCKKFFPLEGNKDGQSKGTTSRKLPHAISTSTQTSR